MAGWTIDTSIALMGVAAAVFISAVCGVMFLRNEAQKMEERRVRRALLLARSLDGKVGPVERSIASEELRRIGYLPVDEIAAVLEEHAGGWLTAPKTSAAVRIHIGVGPLSVTLDAAKIVEAVATLSGVVGVGAAAAGLAALLN